MSKRISLGGATYSSMYYKLTLKNKCKTIRDWLLFVLLIVAASSCLFYAFDGLGI
ncbi:MAG: hypothetical protein COB61_004135 [Thiotrichales bacterium]|nr:hypothetical protein [Thiotrichales bacterium]